MKMMRPLILAAAGAIALAAPAMASAQDWGYWRGDHDAWRWRDRDDWRRHEWREHEWREHYEYRAYPGYYYRRQVCWRETRPTWDGGYVVVRRCRY